MIKLIDLFKAGAHFGHQTRFLNPEMLPYIFGARHKISIIDLDKTIAHFNTAEKFLKQAVARNKKILFVGTKRSARTIFKEEAERAEVPYIVTRWLGGTMTNFATIKQRTKRLLDMEAVEESTLENMTKKERLLFEREKDKLERSVGGIKGMKDIPDVIFVCDVGFHKTAIAEAQKLGVTLVGIVDTNHSPKGIDYIIPANDDSTKAIELYAKWAADCIISARKDDRPEMAFIEKEEIKPADESVSQVQPEAAASLN